MLTLIVKVEKPENTNIILETQDRVIQAIQDRFNDAHELKKYAESVFVEASNAVEVAEAHAADNEIMMAATKKVYECSFSSFSVKVKRPENTNIIQAIEDRFTDAQELKNHAKSVLVEAIYAVRAAEAHAADNEIMMAATEKVYEYAERSFLKARLQVKEVKASLEAAMAGEKNSQMMPIRKDNNKKQDAASAPVEEKTATTGTN
eukprot:scaffold14066_cov40-Cyclotella_meneghiniana.AAC.15